MTSSQNKWPALDGLRGIAVLLVLWHHGREIAHPHPLLDGSWLYRGSLGGWVGVDLFFVLSGFLITAILRRNRGQQNALLNFWQRRAVRIFPLPWLYLLLLFVLPRSIDFPNFIRDFRPWLPFVLFYGNLYIAWHGWVFGCFSILWSLAVEQHFYLLWPPLVEKLSRNRMIRIGIAYLALAPLLRYLTLLRLGPVAVYVASWCRVDTLMAGGLLALCFEHSDWQERFQKLRWLLLLPSLLVFALVLALPLGPSAPAVNPRWFMLIGYTLIALSGAVLVGFCALPNAARSPLAHPSIGYLGKISYGIYVWHFLALFAVQRYAATVNKPLQIAIWLLLSIGGASISWFAFEAPLLKFKPRLSS